MRTRGLSEVAGEDALAARIRHEREQRGWSTSELARLVTKIGCAMNQSAVWKIENGAPRRKITVDELLAFAAVFGVPVLQMLEPPDATAQEIAACEARIGELTRDLRDGQKELERCRARLASLHKKGR